MRKNKTPAGKGITTTGFPARKRCLDFGFTDCGKDMGRKMKVVYMGTPDFAVGALEAIVNAGHEVVLVVTQPDRQKGRGKEVQYSEVKKVALKYNLPVFQPEKIKTPEAVEELKKYEADIFVVAAFGQILSKEILEMPKYGCINIHGSLLPKYRGAAPIQWAVIDGEKVSGVTIMQMDEGLDTGDILFTKEVKLEEKETGASLFDKLAKEGADLVVEALEKISKGEVHPVKQNSEESTYAKMLTKEFGKMDWNLTAKELEQRIRGLNSWPSAYTYYHGKTWKIWEADVVEREGGIPGEITKVEKDGFVVACKEGALRITSVQPEGKKRMSVKDYLLGHSISVGEQLG